MKYPLLVTVDDVPIRELVASFMQDSNNVFGYAPICFRFICDMISSINSFSFRSVGFGSGSPSIVGSSSFERGTSSIFGSLSIQRGYSSNDGDSSYFKRDSSSNVVSPNTNNSPSFDDFEA